MACLFSIAQCRHNGRIGGVLNLFFLCGVVSRLCSPCVVLTRATRSLEPGKIVILLQGRYAGHKAVIVKSHEAGTKERKYPHLVVAGIDVSRCPVLCALPHTRVWLTHRPARSATRSS